MQMRHEFSDVFSAGSPGAPVPNRSLIARFDESREMQALIADIERGTVPNPDDAVARMIQQINRAITSATGSLPIRENLDGEIKLLPPISTPLRDRLPRSPGAGLSAQWRQLTAFGANLGTTTTTTGTTNAANTFVVNNARGFWAGESILYNGSTYVITSINYSTNVITVTSGLSQDTQSNGVTITKASLFWTEPGAAQRMFYAESGSPLDSTETYASRTAAYKLLGDKGSITLFSMAAGANFANQYALAKRNCLMRALLKEEYALLHAENNVTAAPWGDGTTALAYQGLIPFVTANAPAPHLQTSVGALTLEHIQAQLTRIWNEGGIGMYMLVNGVQAEKLTNLATASGNYRVIITNEGAMKVGGRVGYVVHAVSGEEVPIITHRFMPPGRMLFGADRNTHGIVSAEVEVLPQVQAPETAFSERVEGYYMQEIAPASATPEVMEFKIGLYSVPKWINSKVFALSTGVS